MSSMGALPHLLSEIFDAARMELLEERAGASSTNGKREDAKGYLSWKSISILLLRIY